jgi:hypothetical protein
MNLKEDIENKMDQNEFLSKIGWGSIKAFITTILIITGFIKLFELYNFFGYLAIAQVIYIVVATMVFYYIYFWREKPKSNDTMLRKKKEDILTWKDFFYTNNISTENNFVCLATSWVVGLGIYFITSLFVYIVIFCFNNSGSGEVMSLLRMIFIGIGASTFYIYTQRFSLKVNFWKVIGTCIVYGFSLSAASYLLGMIIGISNMVLGLPITIAILTLQLVFTSVYTYIDLLEWSKMTHIVIVSGETPIETTTSGE